MGFKARTAGSRRQPPADMRRALAACDKERQQLELELDESTSKYHELTRKSMDLEEQLSDVLEDKQELEGVVTDLRARLASLEREVRWAKECRAQLEDAESSLVAARAEIERLRRGRPGAARAATQQGPPHPPGPASVIVTPAPPRPPVLPDDDDS